MTWIVANEDEEEFIRELTSHSDRVVALLGQTVVDRRLEAAIKSRWQNDETGKVFKDLFQDSAPLGSFSTRIKIGFVTRLYGKETFKDLQHINKIRNAFAHKLGAKDFQTQMIADRVKQLTLPGRYPITPGNVMTNKIDHPGSLWANAIDMMVKISMLQRDPVDARGRFLRTIEILAAFLWYEEYIARSPGSPGVPSKSLPPSPRF
jgi:DNA-binding MltR family transcriptional regulator